MEDGRPLKWRTMRDLTALAVTIFKESSGLSRVNVHKIGPYPSAVQVFRG